MGRFIGLYLAVTGIGALVVIAAPWLVIIGFFLLVIPGLILSLLPTAFLWGCVFAVAWWLARIALADPFASIVAALVTAVAVCAVTWPGRALGERRLAASILPDVTPAGRLTIAGDIRVETPHARTAKDVPYIRDTVRPFACDSLCVALLFTPGVRSVTVNATSAFTAADHRAARGSLTPGAVTYRLVPKADCAGRAIDPDVANLSGMFGRDLDANRQIAAGWSLKLASDWCIVREAPLARFDLILREGRYTDAAQEPKARSPWLPGAARVAYAEMRDGTGRVLLRRLVSAVHVLAQPLSYTPSGGMENFRFGWTTKRLANAPSYPEPTLHKLLAEHTALSVPPPPGDLLPAMRKALRAAMADPALTATDPAFATLGAYFAGLDDALSPEDEVLVEALIADARLTDYDGLYRLNASPPAQHRRLRAAMVDRLLAAPETHLLNGSGFSDFLRAAPSGSFATLTTPEQRLLDAPERRPYATGLIARLSDGGSATMPRLLALLRHHGVALAEVIGSERKMEATLRSRQIHAHDGVIAAVRVALCRLGPAASGALPAVEQMVAAGVVPPRALNGHGGSDWHLAMARMGRPVETFRKPASMSGTDANHQQRLRDKLARFDPDRSCD